MLEVERTTYVRPIACRVDHGSPAVDQICGHRSAVSRKRQRAVDALQVTSRYRISSGHDMRGAWPPFAGASLTCLSAIKCLESR